MPPGPQLGAILSSIDRDSIRGRDRVLLMRARARQLAFDQAEFQADIYALSDSIGEIWGGTGDPEARFDSTVAEVGAALHLTRRSAEFQVGLALQMGTDYPKILQALREGKIDMARAKVICDQTMTLDPDTRNAVTDQILESATTMTTGQLRARLARLVISVDPDNAAKRYRSDFEERKVTVDVNPDGTAGFHGWHLPAAETRAALQRINDMARSLKSKAESRSLDQLRADVLLDLLHGRRVESHDGGRGTVDIRVDLTTLAGLDEAPGDLNGFGPVIADIARQVANEQTRSEWRITITDPDGQPVMVTTTRRRPTSQQERHVEAVNPTCVFPGDRTPAADCDLDHTNPWADGGPTSTHNLAPLCRHHHRLKDHGWTHEMIKPGHYRWTSPLGHSYEVGPDPP